MGGQLGAGVVTICGIFGVDDVGFAKRLRLCGFVWGFALVSFVSIMDGKSVLVSISLHCGDIGCDGGLGIWVFFFVVVPCCVGMGLWVS
jgi:hypothetical protein